MRAQLAAAEGLAVDAAIVRPYAGAAAGVFASADGDRIAWTLAEDEAAPGFSLSTSDNITWWKALKVYDDAGALLCSLEVTARAREWRGV